MTKFEDGPAQGQVLMLQRAPLFLRVAQARDRRGCAGTDGEWDALDQWEDTPRPGETFYAYRRVGEPARCHMRFGREAKHASGMYSVGLYRFIPDQPAQDVMASNEAWQAWCLAAKGVTALCNRNVQAGQCRSCSALVAWLKTPKGATMPVDYSSLATTDTHDTLYDKDRHVSHFATCPFAAKHSKKKKAKAA